MFYVHDYRKCQRCGTFMSQKKLRDGVCIDWQKCDKYKEENHSCMSVEKLETRIKKLAADYGKAHNALERKRKKTSGSPKCERCGLESRVHGKPGFGSHEFVEASPKAQK